MATTDELIDTRIRGRKVTYYLSTLDDLNNLKNFSLIAHISTVIASIAIGGIISVILTKASGIELKDQTINVLNILKWVFIVVAFIFAIGTVFFDYKVDNAIKAIKGSGEVREFNTLKPVDDKVITTKVGDVSDSNIIKFEIIKAFYYTAKYQLDITEELRRKISNNRLTIAANNDIKGDPEPGEYKRLSIEYKFLGIRYSKEYKEHDIINLP